MRSLMAKRARAQERGSVLVELAIALLIFVPLTALILDTGLGFGAARNTSSASRSAARSAALAGDDRLADYRALDAVRAEFANIDDTVVQVTVYLSPAGGAGTVPVACGLGGTSVTDVCNVYDSATLAGLSPVQFQDADCAGEIDLAWCPTTREDDDGDYLGVAVWTTHAPTIGLINSDDVELSDHSVFALFFPEPPTPLAP